MPTDAACPAQFETQSESAEDAIVRCSVIARVGNLKAASAFRAGALNVSELSIIHDGGSLLSGGSGAACE